MNRFRFLPPLGVIALLAGALAAVPSLETLAPERPDVGKETVPGAAAGIDASGEIFMVPPSEGIAPVFAERPLLMEGRRPPAIAPAIVKDVSEPQLQPEPEAVAPSPPETVEARPPTAPDFTLAGIVIGTEGASALIRRNIDGTEVWLQEGEGLDGWMLAEISQQQVRLAGNDTEITLQLFPQELP